MRHIMKTFTLAAGSMLLIGLASSQAQHPLLKVTLFGQPSVNNDSFGWLWIRASTRMKVWT